MSCFSFTQSNFWLWAVCFPITDYVILFREFQFFFHLKLFIRIHVRNKRTQNKNSECYHIYWTGAILFLRGRATFGQHQESRPLRVPKFLSMRREFVSYSQPIRFVRLHSEHAQSAGSPHLAVLDLLGGAHSWCWPKGARPLGTRMKWGKKTTQAKKIYCGRVEGRAV